MFWQSKEKITPSNQAYKVEDEMKHSCSGKVKGNR